MKYVIAATIIAAATLGALALQPEPACAQGDCPEYNSTCYTDFDCGKYQLPSCGMSCVDVGSYPKRCR